MARPTPPRHVYRNVEPGVPAAEPTLSSFLDASTERAEREVFRVLVQGGMAPKEAMQLNQASGRRTYTEFSNAVRAIRAEVNRAEVRRSNIGHEGFIVFKDLVPYATHIGELLADAEVAQIEATDLAQIDREGHSPFWRWVHQDDRADAIRETYIHLQGLGDRAVAAAHVLLFVEAHGLTEYAVAIRTGFDTAVADHVFNFGQLHKKASDARAWTSVLGWKDVATDLDKHLEARAKVSDGAARGAAESLKIVERLPELSRMHTALVSGRDALAVRLEQLAAREEFAGARDRHTANGKLDLAGFEKAVWALAAQQDRALATERSAAD